MKACALIAGCLLFVAACDSKKDGVDKAAPASASPANAKCTKLVPPSIVAKYLIGYQLEERAAAAETTSCRFMKDPPLSVVAVSFTCRDSAMDAMPGMIEKQKTKGGTEVPGLGRGAVKIGRALMAWDDDTSCVFTIIAEGNEIATDSTAFAKDLVAAVTPASLP